VNTKFASDVEVADPRGKLQADRRMLNAIKTLNPMVNFFIISPQIFSEFSNFKYYFNHNHCFYE
jgi:hypothetical protein